MEEKHPVPEAAMKYMSPDAADEIKGRSSYQIFNLA